MERQFETLLPIVSKVIAELEATYPSREIRLVSEGEFTGMWDGGRLAQIVSNLVSNALRHGAADAPITVTLRGDATNVSIIVHNRGEIPAEVLSQLFDPFRSRSGGRPRTQGLGLGLFIIHQLVLAHGGTIEVTSTAAAGTTFHVQLPRQLSATPAAA